MRDPAKDKVYVVAESRLPFLPGAIPKPSKKKTDKAAGGEEGTAGQPGGFEILSKHPGKELVGLKYTPLFGYFSQHSATAFRVIADTYVTDDSGTGVVHQAPAFGEDDNRVCLNNGILKKGEELPCPVDLEGR